MDSKIVSPQLRLPRTREDQHEDYARLYDISKDHPDVEIRWAAMMRMAEIVEADSDG
jgi:hypothetical protein